MKVLQIGLTDNIGGMETYLIEQYRHLNRSLITYDFVNITSEKPLAFEDEIKQKGDTIYAIPSRHINPIKHWIAWYRLLKDNAYKYDAIVLNTCDQSVGWPLFLAKIFNIKNRIVHSHNSGNEVKSSIFRKLLYKVNSIFWDLSLTKKFACSELAGQWMFGKDSNFEVIRNAIDLEKFRFSEQDRKRLRKELHLEDKFIIGHIGRFSYQKNHEFMIDLLNELVKENQNIHLLLVGGYSGSDDYYWKLIHSKVNKLRLDRFVTFLGMRKDIPELLSSIDCLLLPSHFEGLSVVGIEAQATGVNCCFSDNITNEIEITDLIKFYPLNDLSSWKNKILEESKTLNRDRILTSEQAIQDLSNAGYSISKETQRVERLFLEL